MLIPVPQRLMVIFLMHYLFRDGIILNLLQVIHTLDLFDTFLSNSYQWFTLLSESGLINHWDKNLLHINVWMGRPSDDSKEKI